MSEAAPRRWAAGVEYDGTAYNGWQRHSHNQSVQAVVESALSNVADTPVTVAASGRTDAGVHAACQVVHFDCAVDREADAWRMGGNANLPRDVALQWVKLVSGDFHARYSAIARRYRYVIRNTPSRSALWDRRCCWVPQPLDAAAMHAAAQALCGEHDFSAFRAAACQSPTAMRRVTTLDVSRAEDFLVCDIRGNAFLHHMVRNIVGALMHVGQGRADPAWVAQLLAGRDRTRGAATAPACGLYLLGAEYPLEHDIPVPAPPGFPRGA